MVTDKIFTLGRQTLTTTLTGLTIILTYIMSPRCMGSPIHFIALMSTQGQQENETPFHITLYAVYPPLHINHINFHICHYALHLMQIAIPHSHSSVFTLYLRLACSYNRPSPDFSEKVLQCTVPSTNKFDQFLSMECTFYSAKLTVYAHSVNNIEYLISTVTQLTPP